LLALSGMLVLVPIAAPVHATSNASLPTLTPTVNTYVTGAGGVATSLTIANPLSNSYSITSITVFAPTGFTFTTAATCGTYLNTVSELTPPVTAVTCTNPAPPTTDVGLAPGFSDTLVLGAIKSTVSSPATANPPTSTFTTSIIDAGSTPASYPGPTWTVYTLASGTTITSVTPASATQYIAGTAAITVTATLSTNQPGVPITFTYPGGYPTHGYSASFSPSSTTTVSGTTFATATTSFTPSNHATDSTFVTATSGLAAGGLSLTSLGAITTAPGTPSSVSWTDVSGAFGVGKSLYLTGAAFFGVSTVAGATTMGEVPATEALTVSVSDAYGNTYSSGAGAATVTITSPAGIGSFDNGAAAYVNPITCTTGAALTCTFGSGTAVVNWNYFQTYTYGTTTVLQATITGTYPATNGVPYSVAATSGNIITGTQATALSLAVTGTPTYGVGTTLTMQAKLTGTTQPGVPITFNLCPHSTLVGGACAGSTAKYGGSFSSGAQIGFVVASGTSGTASATYTLPTVLNQVGVFNATALTPTGATPVPTIVSSPYLSLVGTPTVPGAAVGFKVNVQFSDQSTAVGSSLVAGQTTYAYVSLVDQYGNTATNPGPTQLQVQLAASAGSLYATTIYIASGSSATNDIAHGSFGPDLFTVPSSLTVGTVITLTATGALTTGTKSITIVTATPTINLKKGSLNGPAYATGATIYSATGAITFYSKANASAGFNPTLIQIATVGTKIGSSPWVTTLTPNAPNSKNTFSLFFPTGLSTLSINATDNVIATGAKFGDAATAGPFNVLVDPYLPTFTIGTPAQGSGSDTVTVVSTEGDFNTTTFAATYGGVPVPSSSISWSGTQTPGASSTLTATISGLSSGTNTLAVSGSTSAGLSNSASASITITVSFANSVTFTTGSATWGSSGAAQGVFVPVTNSWNTALQLTIYVTLKSGTSTYVLVGGIGLAAGQTGTVFCQDYLTTVPVATYTVTFSAITTSNTVPSAPTTPISLTT